MDTLNQIHLTLHPSRVKPTLRVLLYAILFHRCLDNVEPETHELDEVHIACAPNATIEKEVHAKIAEFQQDVVDAGRDRGEIAVVFLQRKPRKGWFAITEELVPWEEHLISIDLSTKQTRSQVSLQKALMSLLTFCTTHSGNVPPLTGSSDQNTCSYRILVSPPPPSEIFSPSPPLPATSAGGVVPRLTSPPPLPTLAIATATARPPSSNTSIMTANNSSDTPGGGGMGYLEQAKDGLRFVKETAIGWGGRGHGRGGGVSGN